MATPYNTRLTTAQSSQLPPLQTSAATQAQAIFTDQTVSAAVVSETEGLKCSKTADDKTQQISEAKIQYFEMVAHHKLLVEHKYQEFESRMPEICEAYLYLTSKTVPVMQRFADNIRKLLNPLIKSADYGYLHIDVDNKSEQELLHHLQQTQTYLESAEARESADIIAESIITMMKLYKSFWLIKNDRSILYYSLLVSQVCSILPGQEALFKKLKQNDIPDILFNPSSMPPLCPLETPDFSTQGIVSTRVHTFLRQSAPRLKQLKKFADEYCKPFKQTFMDVHNKFLLPKSLESDKEAEELKNMAFTRSAKLICDFKPIALYAPQPLAFLRLVTMHKSIHENIKLLSGRAVSAIGKFLAYCPESLRLAAVLSIDEQRAIDCLESSLNELNQDIELLQKDLFGLKRQSEPETVTAAAIERFESAKKQKTSLEQLSVLFRGEITHLESSSSDQK